MKMKEGSSQRNPKKKLLHLSLNKAIKSQKHLGILVFMQTARTLETRV